MQESLARWIRDADSTIHMDHFQVSEPSLDISDVLRRTDDYYVSLVGTLFEYMRTGLGIGADWARLGNAFAAFAVDDSSRLFPSAFVSRSEAALYAATAFYCGGYPASAYLTARDHGDSEEGSEDTTTICFDLLSRPAEMRSRFAGELRDALVRGDARLLSELSEASARGASSAMLAGPDEWIPARLSEKLLDRLRRTNLRAVLPGGFGELWTPLVESLVARFSWEFFPSQIEAIEGGLLSSAETFSLQMPTGAGKTALCETLLYQFARTTRDSVAVLLVPYRSLASELRGSLVRRLNSMHISARCAYGGTVPTGAEVQRLQEARVMVATPEALSGLLSAEPTFFSRIGLVICDEGHLLDSLGRGVSLELLLARMRAREHGPPRFVFLSAIVPNIEQVNAWLGGNDATVIRSDYRPAFAEFSVLRTPTNRVSHSIALVMHPHEDEHIRFRIPEFLKRADFAWTNPHTNRLNTYAPTTIKTQAIAAARKCLPMGTVAVFAANKRGTQGAIGLVDELLSQLRLTLSLPSPISYSDADSVAPTLDYLEREYGAGWTGTRALRAAAILHHGDVPQETREVFESLVRRGEVRFAICTSTLAEGVNLPIRTLVLYSVQRRRRGGAAQNLLARDIKNLVGRAGRAGAATKGLVICANPTQWALVEPAAKNLPGEAVTGALRALTERLVRRLAVGDVVLSNDVLEATPAVHALIDGVDATLIDLATEEIGEDELIRLAIEVADDTFAARQATRDASKRLLRDVFRFRARRVVYTRSIGRLGWIRETGARVRMLDSVESGLLPLRDSWEDLTDPIEPGLVRVMLDWAWNQPDFDPAVRTGFRLGDEVATDSVRGLLDDIVAGWLAGHTFGVIGESVRLSVDDILGVHTSVVAFVLQTLVEQATALLERFVGSQGREMADAVRRFPDHLRFGVPSAGARILAGYGIRHRRAAIELGVLVSDRRPLSLSEDRTTLFGLLRDQLEQNRDEWNERLGALVFDRTLQDLSLPQRGA